MTLTLETTPCIQIRFLLGTIEELTVQQYEDALRSSRSIGTLRGLSFHHLMWTRDAPPVHQLGTGWQKPGTEAFRISNEAAYHWQMQRLLGLH
jgi:hypothetical protein